ncbi:MAG: alanine racemase [Bryobacteraceae bacterium]|nr:alanine racemase [Bryobacteraceae bacterium]
MTHLNELDTPALVIDVDSMERNLQRTASYAREHGLRLRPHTKTHKIPALGRRQIELGAAGLSVAKTTEGEVMLASGTPDLLLAYPVLGEAKLARLIQLARQVEVTVALDDLTVAQAIGGAAARAGVEIGILVEADLGLHRMGVAPGPELLTLIQAIGRLPGLRWRGVAFYPGHIKSHAAESQPALDRLRAQVPELIDGLSRAGAEPEIVSGGSTPLLWDSHTIPGLNEIRPGTYIFNDRNTLLSGACNRADCAATIVCTVVSVQGDRMMIDGGSKTFSSDRSSADGDALFGEIEGDAGARFHKMNEEHGYVDLSRAERSYRPGDRVRVLMNHVCTAMNLHERVWAVRGDEVFDAWTVAGRGKLQ